MIKVQEALVAGYYGEWFLYPVCIEWKRFIL